MGVVHVDFVLMWETDYSDGSKGSGRSGLILSILDNKSHLETNQGQVFFTSSPDLIAELKEGSIPVALSPDVVDIQEEFRGLPVVRSNSAFSIGALC